MTPEQKNTLTNYFRVSSLEDLNADTDGKRYPDNPGGQSVFITRSAYEVVESTPPPVDLWHGLWHQGEMACLFGEPNVGKTILAMKIASDIVARGQNVLYFDFENAEHQLLPRFAEHSFDSPNSPKFTILTPNYYNHDLPKSNRELIPHILKYAANNLASIIIIDDITHLFGTGDPADVRYVLNTLRSWVKQQRISILVLAHARRRKPLQPITLEHIAGSYECAYSFDSIFSLSKANRYQRREKGISAYIKQHKSRMGEVIYDDENVITASLRFDEKSQSLTLCDFMTGGNERQLLRDFGYRTREEVLKAVLDYKDKSFTICEIADHVGISKSQVGRLLKEHYDADSRPPVPSRLQPLPPMTTEPINPYDVDSHRVVDQGGVDTLLEDDNDLPLRREDPVTGKTYIYDPTTNSAREIKPDQYPNLPFYNPEDDDPNRPLPFMIQLDRRRHARATILPSTPSTSATTPATSAPAIAEGDNQAKNPSMMRSECWGANGDGECSSKSEHHIDNEHPEPLDDDDYEDDEEEDPTPWDPCAYEEPVSYDPAYYELLNNQ